MKVREKSTGKIYTVSGINVATPDPHFDRRFFSPNEVEVVTEEKGSDNKNEVVRKVWIARDSIFDPMFGLGLCVHWKKPLRQLDSWSPDSILFHLSWDTYPEVTWEGGPKEFEICIR